MKGEFHIHTTYSDGEYSVDEILEYLKGNIDYFCITDHDCLNGSIEAFNKAKEYGLKSLVGVEISTYLGKIIFGFSLNGLYNTIFFPIT